MKSMGSRRNPRTVLGVSLRTGCVVFLGAKFNRMITADAKIFKCCGKPFKYYPGRDKLSPPPEDKRLKAIHACDRLFAWRINLTMYYVKAQESKIQLPQDSQIDEGDQEVNSEGTEMSEKVSLSVV